MFLQCVSSRIQSLQPTLRVFSTSYLTELSGAEIEAEVDKTYTEMGIALACFPGGTQQAQWPNLPGPAHGKKEGWNAHPTFQLSGTPKKLICLT